VQTGCVLIAYRGHHRDKAAVTSYIGSVCIAECDMWDNSSTGREKLS